MKSISEYLFYVDTNCDPKLTKYIIPANDDSISSVSLILNILSNSINKGIKKVNKIIKE